MKQFIPILFLCLIALCGIAPLIAGFVKNRLAAGVAGFVVCISAGLFFGLILALPLSIIFTTAIVLKKKDNIDGNSYAPPNPPTFYE